VNIIKDVGNFANGYKKRAYYMHQTKLRKKSGSRKAKRVGITIIYQAMPEAIRRQVKI
jgi:hypothetical protein